MALIYDNVSVTGELLEGLDIEAREVQAELYLPQLVDSGCKLQWACDTKKKDKCRVYPEVVNKDGVIIYPKEGTNKKTKEVFKQKFSLLLPAMQARSMTTDPVGVQYQFNPSSAKQFASKCCFPVPGDDDFDADLYGDYFKYIDVLDKFLGEELVEYLAAGTTKDGEHFQETLFKSMWINQGRDPDRFADYLRAKFNDADGDVYKCRTRSVMSFMKTDLIDVDWVRFKSPTPIPEMNPSDIEYIKEYKLLANSLPPDERAAMHSALEEMESDIKASWLTNRPMMISPLPVLDKSSPPRLISQTELFKFVYPRSALMSVSLHIDGFRFSNGKGALDMAMTAVHLHVNGPRPTTKKRVGTGLTNKAFGGVAPMPLGQEKRARYSSSPEPVNHPAIEYGDSE